MCYIVLIYCNLHNSNPSGEIIKFFENVIRSKRYKLLQEEEYH